MAAAKQATRDKRAKYPSPRPANQFRGRFVSPGAFRAFATTTPPTRTNVYGAERDFSRAPVDRAIPGDANRESNCNSCTVRNYRLREE